MSGPRICWDEHNYLSMCLCIGPGPESDDYYDFDDEDDERYKKLKEELRSKGLLVSEDEDEGCISWSEDPEEFADSLERAARWLRKIAKADLTPDMFHIRTDID